MTDSPGLSRPPHMDDEEWAEYRFSEEARVELTHVPDEDVYSDPREDERADALGEMFGEIEEDGRQAYRDGLDIDDNPYGATLSGEAWCTGWKEEERA